MPSVNHLRASLKVPNYIILCNAHLKSSLHYLSRDLILFSCSSTLARRRPSQKIINLDNWAAERKGAMFMCAGNSKRKRSARIMENKERKHNNSREVIMTMVDFYFGENVFFPA